MELEFIIKGPNNELKNFDHSIIGNILVEILKVCIVLYVQCNTRESLYIGRGKSNAQVKGVLLYKTMYWA